MQIKSLSKEISFTTGEEVVECVWEEEWEEAKAKMQLSCAGGGSGKVGWVIAEASLKIPPTQSTIIYLLPGVGDSGRDGGRGKKNCNVFFSIKRLH